MSSDEWNGAGWYAIRYSDGGQDWTNGGPIWIECLLDFEDEMNAARAHDSDYHLAAAYYLGDGARPE